jgi:hypothetical protein
MRAGSGTLHYASPSSHLGYFGRRWHVGQLPRVPFGGHQRGSRHEDTVGKAVLANHNEFREKRLQEKQEEGPQKPNLALPTKLWATSKTNTAGRCRSGNMEFSIQYKSPSVSMVPMRASAITDGARKWKPDTPPISPPYRGPIWRSLELKRSSRRPWTRMSMLWTRYSFETAWRESNLKVKKKYLLQARSDAGNFRPLRPHSAIADIMLLR